MGNASWIQPFCHFSFPAKIGQSEIKSNTLTRLFFEENCRMENARKKWEKCDQNLSNIRLFGRGVKLTGNLKHMLTAPHIGSLNLIRWKRKLLKSINGSQQISNIEPLKIFDIFW